MQTIPFSFTHCTSRIIYAKITYSNEKCLRSLQSFAIISRCQKYRDFFTLNGKRVGDATFRKESRRVDAAILKKQFQFVLLSTYQLNHKLNEKWAAVNWFWSKFSNYKNHSVHFTRFDNAYRNYWIVYRNILLQAIAKSDKSFCV